jgi:hypothetical protein
MPTPVWMKKVEDKATTLEAKAKADAAEFETWALTGKDKVESTAEKATGYKYFWPIVGAAILVIGYILL